jgi:F5/8 type C domain
MTSSILETKLPDGRDMLIISGSVYVQVGGHSTVPPQTGLNDDPGLVGFEELFPPTTPGWFDYEQKIVIGPEWYELVTKDVVPVVSPSNMFSREISDQHIEDDTGFAVDWCKVDLENKRIKLIIKISLRHPVDWVDPSPAHPWSVPWEFMLRLAYYVTAVGSKSKPKVILKGPPVPPLCTTNLPISGVSASGYQNDQNGSFPPSNATDGSLSTRWSNPGVGSWIRADLGTSKNICRADVAWWEGNTRHYNFVIATSTNGSTFTTVFSGTSSGTTLNSERYSFSITNARYVRVTVNGNNVNSYAHITELDIFGP